MSGIDEREPGSVDGKTIAKRAAFFVAIAIIAGVGLAALPGVDEVRDKLTAANPWWIAAVAVCALNSMMGFVRALWSAFDRVMRFRRAVVLGFAEQGANVLLPAGCAGGPAFGALVLRRLRAGRPPPPRRPGLRGARHAQARRARPPRRSAPRRAFSLHERGHVLRHRARGHADLDRRASERRCGAAL